MSERGEEEEEEEVGGVLSRDELDAANSQVPPWCVLLGMIAAEEATYCAC